MIKNTGFFKRVYELVARIPRGKVMTYGQIAALLGDHKNARTIGWALHSNSSGDKIPCHRVVNSRGELSGGYAFGGPEVQKALLQQEGVAFDKQDRINLSRFLWKVAG